MTFVFNLQLVLLRCLITRHYTSTKKFGLFQASSSQILSSSFISKVMLAKIIFLLQLSFGRYKKIPAEICRLSIVKDQVNGLINTISEIHHKYFQLSLTPFHLCIYFCRMIELEFLMSHDRFINSHDCDNLTTSY